MQSRILLAAAFAGLAAAQDNQPVVTAFIPLAEDNAALVASVIAVGDAATTYAFGCPEGTPSDECGFPPGGSFTVVDGPATVGFELEWEEFHQKADCEINNEEATCVVDNVSGSMSHHITEVVPDHTQYYRSMTVTAGAELLTEGGGDAAPTATGITKAGGDEGSKPTGTDGGEAPKETETGDSGAGQIQGSILAAAVVVAGALLI